ncbi:MAG: GAF domain-containing protein, partial [Armatimonadetes bacterium]|nr:GAF domain-containing protein [Armatimonadota bacterium]
MSGEERLSQATRRMAVLQRQLDAVHLIATELGRVTEIDGIVSRSLEVALEIVGAQAGSILLHDPTADKLVFRYVVGGGGDQLVGTAIDVGRGIAGRAFREGQTLVSDQVSLDPDHATEIEEQTKYITTNMVTVPLKTGDAK